MNIFILTGAGVSAESGLPTFRDADGLWERHSVFDLATPEGFARDPALVRRFYDGRRRALRTAVPNAAHRALARLDTELPGLGGSLFLCTQNIDDLHERGGSRSVAHMHGELRRGRCAACGATFPWDRDMTADDACPACGRAGALRPDVVWFGEMPLGLDRVMAALARADLFAAIGTSGTVAPASDFVAYARKAGARTVEINLEPSGGVAFDTVRLGPAGETVPAWVDEVLTDMRAR